jgi:hypothetical protein
MFSLVWFLEFLVPLVFQMLVVVLIDGNEPPKALQILV